MMKDHFHPFFRNTFSYLKSVIHKMPGYYLVLFFFFTVLIATRLFFFKTGRTLDFGKGF